MEARIGKLKKLRKRSEKLAYRVQIVEQQQRLAELQQHTLQRMGFYQRKEEDNGLSLKRDESRQKTQGK